MSVDIQDMIRGRILHKMEQAGMFVPDEGFDGHSWDSPNCKRSERTLSEVLDGTEEGDYRDGRMDAIMALIDDFAEIVSEEVGERLGVAAVVEFDPQI